MADPICRWRNATPETVRLLVELLPKTEMSEADYKKQLKENCRAKNFDYDKFLTTAYQLAAQIGLYYIDSNGIYHPRFNRVLTDAEANEYVSRVSSLYVSPNPYAKSMSTASSVACLYDLFVQCAGKVDKGVRIDVKKVLEDYYKLPIGNTDMVVNLMVASGSFDKVDGQHIVYRGLDGLANDKERFFNHFGPVDSTVGFVEAMAAADNLREAFIAWMRYCERLSESTINNYIASLDRVSESVPTSGVNRTSGWWAGIYSYLTEAPPPVKTFFEIQTIEELRRYYGAFDLLFAESVNYGGLNPAKYNECRKWAIGNDSKENRRSIKYGYIAYKKFLKWREEQKKPEDKPQPPPTVDRLSIALKLFAAKRNEEEWFADNTGGNTNKPRIGYIANKQLRVLSNTPLDIRKLNDDVPTNIRAWFKNYWDADGNKSWIEGLSDADLSGFGPYIVYLLQMGSPSVSKPDKFTNALDAAVKAIIKPKETGFYDERINEILNFLGLIGFEWKEDFDIDDLGEAVNAQRVIKRRLKDLGIKRIQESATADDGNAPDYITVNEFIWFVKLNLNKIEKEAQEGKMKPAAHEEISTKQKNKKPQVDLTDFEDVLLLRLRAALRTKPFAILAGHSGTGKSRMVRKLAYMTCNDDALRKDKNGKPLKEPGNFCMVQVKPNWHDSSDLLGYYSELGKRYRASDFVKFIVKAYAYPDTPFFVCLDEMNLAPVEQYFAEYLSAIESRKIQKVKVLKKKPLAEIDVETVVSDELIPRSAYVEGEEANRIIHYDWLGCELKESEHWIANYGLTIPRNLFVIGTVNMDESTNQFSRKVLDRAMTIEMTDADFDNFGKKSPELNFDDEYMGDEAVKAMLTGKVQAKELSSEQKENLNKLKGVLAPTSFAVAYRFANEYALYDESLKKTAEVSYKSSNSGEPTEKLELKSAASTENATSSEQSSEALATDGGVTGAKTTGTAPVKTTPAIPSAFDDMVLMKVLPRISGDENEVETIFYKGRVQGKEGSRVNPADKTLMKILDVKKDTESLRKITAILERGGTYLSFWP